MTCHECDQPARSRGRKHNTPEEAFQARTKSEGDCLIWTGSTNATTGYGALKVNGQKVYVHRYAWERVNGPIPEGMVIDHTCWNRACCAIEHLRLATRTQNSSHLRGATSSNKSTGRRNVSPHGKGYMVQVGSAGTLRYGGTYSSIDEAETVATRMRAELFGEFAGKGGAGIAGEKS